LVDKLEASINEGGMSLTPTSSSSNSELAYLGNVITITVVVIVE